MSVKWAREEKRGQRNLMTLSLIVATLWHLSKKYLTTYAYNKVIYEYQMKFWFKMP